MCFPENQKLYPVLSHLFLDLCKDQENMMPTDFITGIWLTHLYTLVTI